LPFAGLDQGVYDLALALAEVELAEVKCWCPDIYAQALQIKLSMILAGLAPSATGEINPPAADSSKVAYVTRDKVGDVERQYTLVDANAAQRSSTPSGLLDGIIARCKAPLRSGAVLARSFTRGGCGCGPFNIADKAERSNGD